MFGNNPIRGKDYAPSGALRVQSMWWTIQGEGPYAGVPAFFIRLAGCNLACTFCDTDFESNYAAPPLGAEQIAAKVPALARLVVLTGGEPLRQNIVPLVDRLADRAMVQAETAGTLWPPNLEDLVATDVEGFGFSFVVSPKTPNVLPQIKHHASAWKYIARAGELDPDDGLPAFSTQKRGTKQRIARPPRNTPPEQIYLQPCWEPDEAATARNVAAVVDACLRFGYRASLQQHRILGVE